MGATALTSEDLLEKIYGYLVFDPFPIHHQTNFHFSVIAGK